MQAAKRFVPLIYLPVLSIEFDLDHIFRIGSVVSIILNHLSLSNLHLKWNLKEKITLSCAILCALFHMLDKVFLWEENVAEFALHGDRMFEDTSIYLYLSNFLSQMPIPLFNILYGFRQILVSTH